jgi:hypothetical protein
MTDPNHLNAIPSLATALAQEVARINGSITQRSGTSSNDAFPYRFWQSFAFSSHHDFTVDFSVDCLTTPSGIRLSADIATDDGSILAEFRDLSIDAVTAAQDRERLLEEWTHELESFVKLNAPLIVQSLIRDQDPESISS